jgi:hypothetical protein
LQALAGLIATLAITAAVAGSWPSIARADGDPASDVLVSQPLFLPQDAGLTTGQQAELGALLSAVRRSGYPLRVAVIAGTADLGSITELWRRPESYARFLGQELSEIYHGTLLVVMPNGFGLYGPGLRSAAQRAAMGRQRPPGTAPRLGANAIAAVRGLAAAAGHPLQVASISAPVAPSHTDYVALLALALGAVLILVAWIASIRVRPLGSRPESSG